MIYLRINCFVCIETSRWTNMDEDHRSIRGTFMSKDREGEAVEASVDITDNNIESSIVSVLISDQNLCPSHL